MAMNGAGRDLDWYESILFGVNRLAIFAYALVSVTALGFIVWCKVGKFISECLDYRQ